MPSITIKTNCLFSPANPTHRWDAAFATLLKVLYGAIVPSDPAAVAVAAFRTARQSDEFMATVADMLAAEPGTTVAQVSEVFCEMTALGVKSSEPGKTRFRSLPEDSRERLVGLMQAVMITAAARLEAKAAPLLSKAQKLRSAALAPLAT